MGLFSGIAGIARTAGRYPGITKIGAYTTAGFMASSALNSKAAEKRNYYGQKDYDRMYRGGIETAASLAPAVGLLAGIGSAMRYGPMGLAKRTINTSAKIGLAPLRYGMPAVGRGMNMLSRKLNYNVDRAIAAYVHTPWPPGPAIHTAANATATQRLSQRLNSWYDNKLLPSIGISGFVGAQALNASTYFGLTATVANASKIAAGAGAAGSIIALKSAHKLGGMPAVAGLAMTAGVGIGTGYYNSQLPVPAAEGNIIDVRSNAQRTLKKMDFNTAGLVQALHQHR